MGIIVGLNTKEMSEGYFHKITAIKDSRELLNDSIRKMRAYAFMDEKVPEYIDLLEKQVNIFYDAILEEEKRVDDLYATALDIMYNTDNYSSSMFNGDEFMYQMYGQIKRAQTNVKLEKYEEDADRIWKSVSKLPGGRAVVSCCSVAYKFIEGTLIPRYVADINSAEAYPNRDILAKEDTIMGMIDANIHATRKYADSKFVDEVGIVVSNLAQFSSVIANPKPIMKMFFDGIVELVNGDYK